MSDDLEVVKLIGGPLDGEERRIRLRPALLVELWNTREKRAALLGDDRRDLTRVKYVDAHRGYEYEQ